MQGDDIMCVSYIIDIKNISSKYGPSYMNVHLEFRSMKLKQPG